MGVVYEAHRVGAQFQQRVALKVIKRGMDTDEVVRRFADERRTLARLDHPGIARLVDGGATEDGRPYLAMEFVEGLPIDRYCDLNKLDVRARLSLFLRVCAAVESAHASLVVHRDIKPVNILVTPDGSPRLVDFGIARVLDEALGRTPDVTAPDSRLMTPDYSAPEVIRGEPVTTAADVYSLGVLLYELLSGARPYELSTRPRAEAERIVTSTDPIPPSQAVTRRANRSARHSEGLSARNETPERLKRRLSGDLDNITLMAMRREPNRRYASVAHLAEDVRRHLAGLPVSARSPTLGYRTTKFVRRHLIGVAAAAVIALILAGSAAGIAAQAQVARNERDAAITARAQAERITAFIREMLESADPNKAGRDVLVRDVLAEAASRAGDELGDHPLVEAAVRSTIGRTYVSLGDYNAAEEQLQLAVSLYESQLPPTHPDLAAPLGELGIVKYWHEELAEGEALFRRVLDIQQRAGLAGAAEEAQTLNNLAAVVHRQRRLDDAESLNRQALAIRERVLGPAHLDTAESLNNLSGVLRSKGDLESAAEYLARATEIREAELGPKHPLVVQCRSNLAALLVAQEQYSEAEAMYDGILADMESNLGAEHPNLAFPLRHVSLIYRQTGRAEQAEPVSRRVLSLVSAALHPGDWRVTQAHIELAFVLIQLDRYQDAETLLDQALTDLDHPQADRARGMQPLLRAFVTLYDHWGKPEQAQEFRTRLDSLAG
jgi:serine/threonine-protein kinase